jgi:hypothetical protein
MSFSLNSLLFERFFKEKQEKSNYYRNLFVFLQLQSVWRARLLVKI